MTILLDTNALIWLLSSKGGKLFGPKSIELIKSCEGVYVSSVSVLEIRIKSMLGKLEAPDTLRQEIINAGLKELSFSAKHADAISSFPELSKHDPFDRMLLAQSIVEKMSLLTSDRFLLNLNVNYLLDARK